MNDLQTLTNGQLIKKYEALQKRASKFTDRFIDLGFGRWTALDMRAQPDRHELFKPYIEILDTLKTISIEAELRYGPGFIHVGQLKHVRCGKRKNKY